MMQLLHIIIVTSIWCLGLTIATQEHMVLYPIRKWAEEKKSKWYEPVIICEWCMPSLHCLFGYLFCIGIGIIDRFQLSLIIMYPLAVSGSSLLTGMTWALYNLINNATKYYINAEKLKYFDIKDRKDKYNRSHLKSFNNVRV